MPRRHTTRSVRPTPLRLAIVGTALAGGVPRVTPAQPSAHGIAVAVQGIADAEFWKTDSGSALLARNGGRPGALGRVHLWGAAELGRHVVVYAAGTAEGGNGRDEPEAAPEWYTDLAGVRYTQSEAFVVDAGKLTYPVGAFAARRYSTRNPLIGAPDGYPVEYPLGVQLSGAHGRVDYRAAVISLPLTHDDYLPEAGRAPRPALGAGVTLTTGVRVGASATWGPYLNDEVPPSLLAGRSWRDYHERVTAVDAQVSRGYLELRGELAASRYDVPGEPQEPVTTVRGVNWYGEAKYTLSPRLFVAGRVERNKYAYIEAEPTEWEATSTDMYNGEVGAGYRVDARTLVKASVRADRWNVAPALRSVLPNGAALALQLSRAFDVLDVSLGGR
jgi:hypothetical protein